MNKRWFLSIATALWVSSHGIGAAQQPTVPKISPKTWQELQEKGVVRVIVELNVPFRTEILTPADEARQRSTIAASQKLLLAELAGTKYKVLAQGKSSPWIALEVDFSSLMLLEHSPHVKSVNPEAKWKPLLSESVPLIEGTDAWAAGYDGTGQTIVGTFQSDNHQLLK